MNHDPKIRLICFPYAGGNKYSFNQFFPYLEDVFECVTIELPGRGRRFGEALLGNIPEMVDDFYMQIQPYLDADFVFYAHSMGGILSNALIHKLKDQDKRLPLFLFATGCAAPQFRKEKIILHLLSDEEFKEELKKLGGFPNEVLENKELVEFLLPILRSDIKALETNVYSFTKKHTVPIIAGIGTEEELTEDQINGWNLESTSSVEIKLYKGNHFFILQHFKKLADLLKEKLGVYLESA